MFCQLTHFKYCLWKIWVYPLRIEEFVKRKVFFLIWFFHWVITILNTYRFCWIKWINEQSRYGIKQLYYEWEWTFGIHTSRIVARLVKFHSALACEISPFTLQYLWCLCHHRFRNLHDLVVAIALWKLNMKKFVWLQKYNCECTTTKIVCAPPYFQRQTARFC